jgi:hypothetical protein
MTIAMAESAIDFKKECAPIKRPCLFTHCLSPCTHDFLVAVADGSPRKQVLNKILKTKADA